MTRVLLIVLAMIAFLGCQENMSAPTASSEGVSNEVDTTLSPEQKLARNKGIEALEDRKVEIRVAYESEREGCRKVTIESSGETRYLSDENIVTGRNIVNMRVTAEGAEKPSIRLIALDSVDAHMQEVTGRNIGNSAVILINGKAAHSLYIDTAFGKYFSIGAGKLSADELEELMKSMYGNGI